MNAIPLFHQDGKPTHVFYCSACRGVARTEESANQCCLPNKCECGVDCEKYHSVCNSCSKRKEVERETAAFAKAAHVPSANFAGWIYSEGHGHSEGYFDSVESLEEYCEDEGIKLPEYAWSCTEVQFVHFDTSNELERIGCDSGLEDFDPRSLDGLDALNVAVEAFNEANKAHVCYQIDYTRAILLKP